MMGFVLKMNNNRGWFVLKVYYSSEPVVAGVREFCIKNDDILY